ncbi:MAG: hypothetical protein NW200_02430 [Hyphomonadaceae bacterium]|nr:hypothetical protein [Hyphomonadaceae bacterium]
MSLRGLLILLACAVPVLLASPAFWWLIESETGAAPGGIVEHDGAARATTIGPKSPWPDWAPVPADAELTVRTYYADAPGHAATGSADLALARPAREEVDALKTRLAAEGWSVTTGRFDTTDPAHTRFSMCTIVARQAAPAERVVTYGIPLTPSKEIGPRMFWSAGAPIGTWTPPPGPAC